MGSCGRNRLDALTRSGWLFGVPKAAQCGTARAGVRGVCGRSAALVCRRAAASGRGPIYPFGELAGRRRTWNRTRIWGRSWCGWAETTGGAEIGLARVFSPFHMQSHTSSINDEWRLAQSDGICAIITLWQPLSSIPMSSFRLLGGQRKPEVLRRCLAGVHRPLINASTLTIRMPDDTHERLKHLATARSVSMNKLIEILHRRIGRIRRRRRFGARAARGGGARPAPVDKLDRSAQR